MAHIVEKRPDYRERYVRHAIDTLSGPFEVWRVQYDNGDYRLAFVGAYEAKNDMPVIVDVKRRKYPLEFHALLVKEDESSPTR
ncbi:MULTISPECIES: hypothetical protein [Pseudomonas syringae group]|uniref:hypothetical protein n=1 Tax=Pseudomonas syringae group TaxID=136849 RepID=UPI001EFBA652|nr:MULTISPECIES: hypothetical protein [Pseudomonas syringae group]